MGRWFYRCCFYRYEWWHPCLRNSYLKSRWVDCWCWHAWDVPPQPRHQLGPAQQPQQVGCHVPGTAGTLQPLDLQIIHGIHFWYICNFHFINIIYNWYAKSYFKSVLLIVDRQIHRLSSKYEKGRILIARIILPRKCRSLSYSTTEQIQFPTSIVVLPQLQYGRTENFNRLFT